MNRGFTILEMILVLTVISLIVLVTVPNISQKKQVIGQVGCQALTELINGQILLYDLENGEKPEDVLELVDGGYITENQCYCPDGTRISIIDGEAFSE